MKTTSVGPDPGPASFDRWLRGDASARPADRFPHAPDLEGIAAAAAAAQRTVADRADVVRRLVDHNEALGHADGARLAGRLLDPRSLVVVAGQQPGVFGGPWMLFAKVAGAVLLARRVEERLGVPVVPVFWNHSEDHDLEEVNRFATLRGGSVHRSRLPVEPGGGPLDALRIDEGMVTAAAELLAVAGARPRDPESLGPVCGERWPEWTSRVVRTVLAGLPAVHAEPIVLRPALRDFFASWIREAAARDASIRAGMERVRACGLEPQVQPVDGGHLFVVDAGRRRKLRYDGRWSFDVAADGGEAELLRIAEEEPERLSCSVLARPVALQHLLPVVAHVNGPAENAYFAQLVEVFAATSAPLPVCVPRPRTTVIGSRERAAMDRLGIDDADLVRGPDSWPEPAAADDPDGERFAAVRRTLAGISDDLASTTSDEGLRRGVAGWSKKVGDATDRLERSFAKAREQASGAGRSARHRLAEWVHPTGRPQDRVYGPLALLRGRDPGESCDILGRLEPLDFRHHVVTLEDPDPS